METQKIARRIGRQLHDLSSYREALGIYEMSIKCGDTADFQTIYEQVLECNAQLSDIERREQIQHQNKLLSSKTRQRAKILYYTSPRRS